MSFLEVLNSWDAALLLAINGANTPFCDDFFFLLSEKLVWFPLLLTLLILLFVKQRKRAIWTIIILALTILVADQLASGVIKPLVQRLRPTHEPTLDGLVHIVHNYRGGKFGFVSSHASNGFAIALLMTLLLKPRLFGYTLFSWAALSSYTRMYLGVHYPGDILCGAVVGLLAAWGMYSVVRKIRPNVVAKKPVLSFSQEVVLTLIFVATVAVCYLFHSILISVFIG